MKQKLALALLVIMLVAGVFLTLTGAESSCSPGDTCWDSYSATATAQAGYPGPYPAPNSPPVTRTDTLDYECYLPLVFANGDGTSSYRVRGECVWHYIYEPPPDCWCHLLLGEPDWYVPMGCQPEDVIPYDGG